MTPHYCEASPQARLSGRQRPLHAILGGGKVFLCMVSLPVMYEQYEYEVYYLASKGNKDLKRLFKTLDSKVLRKIPRGPVKEKEFR